MIIGDILQSNISIKGFTKPSICPICRTPNSFIEKAGGWKCTECGHEISNTLNQTSLKSESTNSRKTIHRSPNFGAILIVACILISVIGGILGQINNNSDTQSDDNTSALHTPSGSEHSQTVNSSFSNLISGSSYIATESSHKSTNTYIPVDNNSEPVWQRFERSNGYFYGFVDSTTDGYVEYHFDNGDVYKGIFNENGYYDGQGVLIKSNGDYYEGNFHNGDYHGYGELFWASGDIYKGQWENGEYVGEGEYYWTNGDWYIGTFINDENTYIDGSGRYKKGELIYAGYFTKGFLNGEGKLYTINNELIYSGNFSEDYFEGKGTYYFPDSGFTYENWDNGCTEVLHLTTNDIPSEKGYWWNNNFYGLIFEVDGWYNVEIIDGVKNYSGDYAWMLE
jgi:ribosomal protein L37AE/L43A